MGDAMNAYWLNPIMPDLAQRTWWLLRNYHIPGEDPTRIKHPKYDRVDPGNFNIVDGYVRGALAACASEFGEPELAHAFEESLARYRVQENGARRYTRISMWSNFWLVLARFGRQDAMRSLIVDGIPDPWKTGPRLTEAAYPDVIVTRAASDGQALDLVLRSGNGGKRTTLRLDRLRPDATYTVEGAPTSSLTVAQDGTALLDVDLDGRKELRVLPTA